jgi:hypothetical protein
VGGGTQKNAWRSAAGILKSEICRRPTLGNMQYFQLQIANQVTPRWEGRKCTTEILDELHRQPNALRAGLLRQLKKLRADEFLEILFEIC